jgi:hypothetical protein
MAILLSRTLEMHMSDFGRHNKPTPEKIPMKAAHLVSE